MAPNGDVGGIPIPIPIPQVGPSFADVGKAIAGFFGFGGGRGPTQAPVPAGFTPSGRFEGFIDVRTGEPPSEQVLFGAEHGNPFLLRALVPGPAGRAPIPTPAEGGPPLVTERFADNSHLIQILRIGHRLDVGNLYRFGL